MSHKVQTEEGRRRADQAEMPPPTRRPTATMSFSVQQMRADAQVESPGIPFEPANPVVGPVAGVELQLVRRSARVAALKQVLEDQVPDREVSTSGVPQQIPIVKSETPGSRQGSVKMRINTGDGNGIDAKASRVVSEAPVVKSESSGSHQDGVKMVQESGQRMDTGDGTGSVAKIPTKDSDEEQASQPRQASQPESDDDSWAHRLWTNYFGYAPDPWWYDRDWRSWYGNGR